MSLQHELCNTCMGIPELDTTVLRTTEHPIAMRSKRNTKHKVLRCTLASPSCQARENQSYLVAFEGADALAARRMSWYEAVCCGQLPHLDGLVKTATDQAIARRSKGNRVDTILVALLTLKTNDQLATGNVPNTNTLVKRPSGDVEVVRRNGNRGDAILDGKVGDL